MPRVLVTGMSGAGKSALLAELRRRGHLTVDTDHDGWTLLEGTWDERRMDDLPAEHADVVVSGTVDNQGRFYDRFDHVVLLSAPLAVLLERVRSRTDNPYGGTADQRAEVARYVDAVEPSCAAAPIGSSTDGVRCPSSPKSSRVSARAGDEFRAGRRPAPLGVGGERLHEW